MSSEALKILVAGDVCGKFNQLFHRVRNVNKKAGPFEMLLCVGDFFGDEAESDEEWQKYTRGEEKIPIATFILGPNQESHVKYFKDLKGCELCENVTYLGKKGVYTGASGIKIAYLSGVQSQRTTSHEYSRSDIDALGLPLVSNSSFKGVDILLTSQWPKDVSKYGSQIEGFDMKSIGAELISEIALALRPRYHFAGLEGAYYERLPYRNHKVLSGGAKHVTRFLGLAKVGNAAKRKYLYAFSIVPMCNMDNAELTKQPHDVTECPYSWQRQEVQKPQTDMSNQYFYSTSQTPDRGKKRHSEQGGEREKKPKRPSMPQGACWFCLGNADVEKHHVVSVGSKTYVALAKGGLVDDHVLILPIGHFQSSVDLPENVLKEMERYKSALKKFFKSVGKACVIFERNFRTSHLQLQVVPVDGVVTDDIKEEFLTLAEEHNIELNEIPTHSQLRQILSVGAPYFYVELDNGGKLLHRIRKFFPLQFGREVMASRSLLDMPERVDWKECSLSKEKETELAAKFRKSFNKFDPFAD